jgi:hypothetical protein
VVSLLFFIEDRRGIKKNQKQTSSQHSDLVGKQFCPALFGKAAIYDKYNAPGTSNEGIVML